MTTTLARPLPRPNAQTRPYWDACARGQLKYQSCTRCGRVQFTPRALCEQCQCTDLGWHLSERIGTVLTFTTVHRAPLPVFKAMTPYVIALIDMKEGFRLMANATADVSQKIAIGSTVQIGFTEVDGTTLPMVQSLIEVPR